MKHRYQHIRNKFLLLLALPALLLAGISGPAATQLQMRSRIAANAGQVDVVYLVCGARAQHRRLRAMQDWLQQPNTTAIRIWIGNDTQNSLWSRPHQRNLTRAEWAYEYANTHFATNPIRILPGNFSNTDGEMMALADVLATTPEIHAIALVTCGFHARRTLARFAAHGPDTVEVTVIPVIPYWENRAPWIVVGEWLKIFRDHLHLTQHPWLSRQDKESKASHAGENPQ